MRPLRPFSGFCDALRSFRAVSEESMLFTSLRFIALAVAVVPAAFALRAGSIQRHAGPIQRTLRVLRRTAGFSAAEPTLRDFAVSGGPKIYPAATADSAKPVLLYLPGIEMTGYSLHRQVPDLQVDFDVRWLANSPEDRTNFTGLADIVQRAIEDVHASGRSSYLCGESFGGVLALYVALRDSRGAPAGLSGVVLINPATSVERSWPAQLPGVLDALGELPPVVSEAAYMAIATPIFSWISGDPLQLGGRAADESLPSALRTAAALGRLASQLPLLTELPTVFPRATLAFRLSMLLDASRAVDKLALSQLTLPVEVISSSEDRVLPSTDEARRLARALPNAQITRLRASGHVPLLEARVRLAKILRDARLIERAPRRAKDYVNDFTLPTAAEFANASRSLASVRKLTSPVWLSTDARGRRVAGLGGLPPLPSFGASVTAEPSSPLPGAEPDGTSVRPPPVLFIGNHQLYGFLDLPLLVEEIHKQTGTLVRALAHPVAFGSQVRTRTDGEPPSAEPSADELRGARAGGFVDFEQFGCVPVSPGALFKLLRRGESTLLYPGGVREAFKSTKQGEAYKLFWPSADESSDFARVAAKFGATIVPVAAVGAEDGFQMLLDADELLSLPVLGQRVAQSAARTPVGRPGERFVAPVSVPRVPGRYYFLFGAPIETRGVDPTDKAACAALYASVRAELEGCVDYLLEKRKHDPWEAALPRVAVEASWDFAKQAPSFPL